MSDHELPPAIPEFAEPENVALTGTEAEVKAESARRTRRSFLLGGVTAAAGYGLYRAIDDLGPIIGHQRVTFRRTFQADAKIMRALFGERGLSPTYPLSRGEVMRFNGSIGIDQEVKLDSYRLQVAGVAHAKGHPRYAADVTDWDYDYGSDTDTDSAAPDLKQAPGSGDASKKPQANAQSGDDAKQASPANGSGSAPDAQKAKPNDGDSKSGAAQPQKEEQEPGSGAGSGQPVHSGANAKAPAVKTGRAKSAIASDDAPQAANASHNLDAKTVPMVNGLPHLTLAERFDKMAQEVTGKRNIGGDEAGASASSLDIGTPGLQLTLDDLQQKLPFREHVTQFRCIEGWSQIIHWGGYRMADFIEAYPPERINGRLPRYVYMETPDGNYYGGFNMNAMLHPQTLLCTHMMGEPLTQAHGAPLRLFTPIKYGYKQIKRVGTISYTDTKPDDYWTKLGYDWYAGL